MTRQIKVLVMVLAALLICTGTVSAYTGETKSVNVIDLDFNETISTEANTVEELLKTMDITLRDEDEISKDLTSAIQNNDVIEITRSFPVYITIDSVPRMIYTSKKTVGEVLSDYKEIIGSSYIIEGADEKTSVRKDSKITLSTVKETIVKQVLKVPFEKETVETDSLTIGTNEVIQAGVEGETVLTIKNTYKGTEIVKTEEVGKTVSSQPVNEIVNVGTKEIPVNEIAGYAYKSTLNVSATGYTRYDAGCDEWTSTGKYATKGIIAVDPRVIPLGTEVYVPGYGYAVAEDVGGAIKSNKIDLCYDTVDEAFSWGRRNVTIYILE